MSQAGPRTPNFVRFIVSGAVVGVVVGVVITVVGDSATDYPGWSQLGLLAMTFGLLGALLGAVVGVLLERRR